MSITIFPVKGCIVSSYLFRIRSKPFVLAIYGRYPAVRWHVQLNRDNGIIITPLAPLNDHIETGVHLMHLASLLCPRLRLESLCPMRTFIYSITSILKRELETALSP